MNKDQVYGWAIFLVSLVVIVGYIWVVFFPPAVGLDVLVLKLTGTLAIVFGFGVMAWIGYTLATTPSPEPIEIPEAEVKPEVPEKSEEAKWEREK